MRLAAARWRMLALVGAVRLAGRVVNARGGGGGRPSRAVGAASTSACTRSTDGRRTQRRRASPPAIAEAPHFWMAQSGGEPSRARWRAAAGGARDAVSTAAVATTAEQRTHRATLRAAVDRWRTRSARPPACAPPRVAGGGLVCGVPRDLARMERHGGDAATSGGAVGVTAELARG